jgi:hypothetical protein
MTNFKKAIQGLNKQLNKSGKLTIMTDAKTKSMLKQEAKRLQDLLRQEISYYKTVIYPIPVVYERTGNWEDSIYVAEPYKDVDGRWVISIKFDRDKAIHPSVIYPNDPSWAGYVPWLMEVGWRTRYDEVHPIYMFTRFEGVHYIKKAIDKYNQNNQYGIQVHVYWGDQLYI